MSKLQIGFYLFYQVFDQFSGSTQSIISKKIKELSLGLEKEINSRIKDKGYRFKLYYDIVTNKNATLEHYSNYLKKRDVSFVCQAPNYFKTQDWTELTKDVLYFDSFNFLKDIESDNVFFTPLTIGVKKEIKKAKAILDKKRLIKVVCVEEEKTEENKGQLSRIKKETKDSGIDFKVVYGWKKDNYSALKKFYSGLKKNQVVYLDSETFVNNSKLAVQGKIENRIAFLKCFVQTESEASFCGVRMDSRMMHDCFIEKERVKNHKIFNLVTEDFIEKLDLQDKIFSLGTGLEKNVTNYLNWYYQIVLDKVSLIYYLLSKKNFEFNSKKELIVEIKKRLCSLNGVEDVFVGSGEVLSFEKNTKETSSLYMTQIDKNYSENLKTHLYKKQGYFEKEELKTINVNYPNFDFIKIHNISIENSTFDTVFYFELTTKYDEGIKIIRFNNVVNESFEAKLLKKKVVDGDFFYFRYHIRSSFTFLPRAENYPFDKQTIYLSYSLVDKDYGMLQTIKRQDVDVKFDSDGWNTQGFRSGLIRKKENFHPVLEKSYVLVSEDNRIGIALKRPSSFTVVKVLVPLAFLGALVVYGLYLPLEFIERNIALSTTAFLSAIALYFSTERPKPLSLTTIDLIFLLFYVFVGAASIAVFALGFFPEIYDEGLKTTRWGLLIYSLGCLAYLIKRINSKKYSAKMVFNEKG